MPLDRRDIVNLRNIGRSFGGGLAGLAITGAVVGYLLQPLFRFADPYDQEASAILIGMGLFFGWLTAALRRSGWPVAVPIVVAIGGLFYVTLVLDKALEVAQANDARCVVIQHHMLSQPTSRPDDAAMMQALQCRPQGSEMPVYARG